MITVVDTAISNIGSVLSALERIGVIYHVTKDSKEVGQASAILLPGVGAFADGMKALRHNDLVEPIRAHAAAGRPLLGICLGMQLLADGSDEFGSHEGLGLIPGWVRRLPGAPGLRVPNIGWCDVHVGNGTSLFAGLESNTSFYFVHSYVMECDDADNTIGSIDFGDCKLTVACQRGNIFGAQFHPEKSQDAGLTFLSNFARTEVYL